MESGGDGLQDATIASSLPVWVVELRLDLAKSAGAFCGRVEKLHRHARQGQAAGVCLLPILKGR